MTIEISETHAGIERGHVRRTMWLAVLVMAGGLGTGYIGADEPSIFSLGIALVVLAAVFPLALYIRRVYVRMAYMASRIGVLVMFRRCVLLRVVYKVVLAIVAPLLRLFRCDPARCSSYDGHDGTYWWVEEEDHGPHQSLR